jgi:2-keto-4-pentenoate hydratase/2-oxohepta-3-ene-1,7-dioic acid hydratase in catechol pathway
MQFLTFKAEGRVSYGVCRDDGVVDLGARLGQVLPDLKSYLQAKSLGLASDLPEVAGVDYRAGQFSYEPVIPNPTKILCVGHNYEEHRKETRRPKAAHPSVFTRFADTLIGHQAAMVMPQVSNSLDYEGELAIVIGRPGFRVPEADAMRLVGGYACFNDGSLRDWQWHTGQFTPGKNFLRTGSFGPVLVSPEEVDELDQQPIETRLNGAVMQSAVLGDMVFSVSRIIAYVSSFTPLAAGDVIATGTPGGVGAKREPPQFMKVGDTVEVTIGGIGHLVNRVAAEATEG